jgi:hypothetical protein
MLPALPNAETAQHMNSLSGKERGNSNALNDARISGNKSP